MDMKSKGHSIEKHSTVFFLIVDSVGVDIGVVINKLMKREESEGENTQREGQRDRGKNTLFKREQQHASRPNSRELRKVKMCNNNSSGKSNNLNRFLECVRVFVRRR
jgi:hypothetical protein